MFFTGSVQGVGFRFAAERIANRMDLEGFVRNLPDGRVEALCEGPEDALRDFLGELTMDMDGYISASDIKWCPALGEFSGFRILY